MKKTKIIKIQQGTTLVVALILLLITTIGSLSLMAGVKSERKMGDNLEQYQLAFQAAEEVLRRVEKKYIEDVTFTEANFLSSCTGAGCFTPSCVNGLCATINYPSEGVKNCNISESIALWEDPNIRSRAPSIEINIDRKNITETSENVILKIKYLIEFRCHVPKVASPSPDVMGDWARYFRVTVWTDDDQTLDSPIMLQSTYQKG